MRLSDDTYEFIKGEVVFLFTRYGVKCVPINGMELALKMGITLIPYSSLSEEKHSAVHRISDDGFFFETNTGEERIYYNDEKPYSRINMTLLHEIAHIVLDHNDDTDPDIAEAEAKFFAKYALAPPPLVHRFHPGHPEEIEDIFDISFTAACFAYDYYRKWLHFHNSTGRYHTYEVCLLRLIS